MGNVVMAITCCAKLIIEKEDSHWKGIGWRNTFKNLEM
jgi:hypothetical protein